MARNAIPLRALIRARPNLAAGRAEIKAHRIARVGGHRLTKDGEPSLLFWQTVVQPLPSLARIARHIGGRLATWTRARPDLRAVHWKNPDRLWVARMQNHRKADVTDRLRHLLADTHPAPFTAIHSV